MLRKLLLAPLLALVLLLVAGPGSPVLPASPQAGQAASDGKVNINTATKAELTKLHGIGPGLADKIIEYRNAHGPFQKPEDLRKVQGVGKGLWEKNREAITVK